MREITPEMIDAKAAEIRETLKEHEPHELLTVADGIVGIVNMIKLGSLTSGNLDDALKFSDGAQEKLRCIVYRSVEKHWTKEQLIEHLANTIADGIAEKFLPQVTRAQMEGAMTGNTNRLQELLETYLRFTEEFLLKKEQQQ